MSAQSEILGKLGQIAATTDYLKDESDRARDQRGKIYQKQEEHSERLTALETAIEPLNDWKKKLDSVSKTQTWAIGGLTVVLAGVGLVSTAVATSWQWVVKTFWHKHDKLPPDWNGF